MPPTMNIEQDDHIDGVVYVGDIQYKHNSTAILQKSARYMWNTDAPYFDKNDKIVSTQRVCLFDCGSRKKMDQPFGMRSHSWNQELNEQSVISVYSKA